MIDIDATLVTAQSDKESAAPTFKRGYGSHPLWAFIDHGAAGTGEPAAVQLRPGNADGNGITAFATNTAGGPGTQLPDLELRHRRRAPLRRPHPRGQGTPA